MNKKTTSTVFGILIIIILACAGYFYSDSYQEKSFYKKISQLEQVTQDQVSGLIEQAGKWEAKLADPEEPLDFTVSARYWKSIGDGFGLKYGYQRAVDHYESALDYYGQDNAMLLQGAADMYKALGKYKKSEKYYERAIKVSQGNAGLYQKLGILYRYRMEKSPEEVLSLYARALERIVFGAETILKERAVYYEEIGMHKEAMLDWAKIYAMEPYNHAAQEEYERLLVHLKETGEWDEITTTTPFDVVTSTVE